MSLDIANEKGVSLDQQKFTWREMVRVPFSKLDDDAFTRVRVLLLSGVESEAVRFQHLCGRMNKALQVPLSRVRRVEQHQQTTVNWLLPPDQSALETTIAYEQAAIEVTASVAQYEPDPYIAQIFRFGMVENFDHLYRFSSLMDRMEGRDPNNILQSYTDIRPGRPTVEEHRAPEDDLRAWYDRYATQSMTKVNVRTVGALGFQMHDYFMSAGPTFADPVARQLYAEVASITEQHVTQYESLVDPDESWLERWVLHEATEVYNYYACHQQESNPRLREIWQRFCDYELGHLHFVMELFRDIERRDPLEIVPATLPDPVRFESQRDFVRKVLTEEPRLRARGSQIIDPASERESQATIDYRKHINAHGSPSEIVAAGYKWSSGTEITRRLVG